MCVRVCMCVCLNIITHLEFTYIAYEYIYILYIYIYIYIYIWTPGKHTLIMFTELGLILCADVASSSDLVCLNRFHKSLK